MSDGKSFGITPLTAKFTLAGQGVALIADESKKVGLSDFNGGRSSTWRDEKDGRIHLLLSNSLLRGRPNEPSVLDVLGELLAGTIEKGDDARGEDARLRTPESNLLTIQIVTVPPEETINREIKEGETVERVLTDRQAAEWIAMSIQKKLNVAADTTILVLDARPYGILADAAVVREFHSAFPELSACRFNQIWLIGPLAMRSVRLK
jgi:hypothetical protein